MARTNTGYRASDSGIERGNDARGVYLALLGGDIGLRSSDRCRDDAGEDARKSQDECELHVAGGEWESLGDSSISIG